MSLEDFISATTWTSILIILFGVLFNIIDNSLTTWLIFTFLCIVGLWQALVDLAEKNRKK